MNVGILNFGRLCHHETTVETTSEPLLTKPGFCSSGAYDHPALLTHPRALQGYSIRGSMSNCRSATCNVLDGEQRGLADIPRDHEQSGMANCSVVCWLAGAVDICIGNRIGRWRGCAMTGKLARAVPSFGLVVVAMAWLGSG